MKTTEYTLSNADADVLRGAALVPADQRKQVLFKYLRANGTQRLLGLFVQFIGLANSVAENAKTAAEDVAVSEFGVHPHTAEKINMPSIIGALDGVLIANSIHDTASLCQGCAFRLGTAPNQCSPTVTDATHCVEDHTAFMCNKDMDEPGEPTKGCAGFAKARACQHEKRA